MSLKVTPYAHSGLNKKQQVAAMFNNIAWRYDFLNHFLSLGIDRYWRRKTIGILGRKLGRNASSTLFLDIATGTADLAIESTRLKPVKVCGIDISADMLAIGKKKVAKKNLRDKIELLEGDSENMIFDNNKFDAVTVAFGVRNFDNLEKGLGEIHRVLKPGGVAVILEFSQPQGFPVKQLYHFYSTKLCPFVGKLVSKDTSAYTYLYRSVEQFPSGTAFRKILEKSGFVTASIHPLTFGVVSVYSCNKPV